jgi:hypothetical protein
MFPVITSSNQVHSSSFYGFLPVTYGANILIVIFHFVGRHTQDHDYSEHFSAQ